MGDYIQGTCLQMCPAQEITLRKKEKLIHILELVPGTRNTKNPKADEERMVKSFSRSAAGKNMNEAHNLRPPMVLLQTINYLLHDIITIEYLPWHVIYNFIMDRLRSVRQDMVIQSLPNAHSISILQPIVRFYAYAAYRLCTEDIKNFDPVINKTHLQECLKRLLSFYDDYDAINSKIPSPMKSITFSNVLIEYRPYFEALYTVFNLGNEEALNRVICLPTWCKDDLVQHCTHLSLNYVNGNFVRVCKLIKNLPPLLCAVASLHLQEIRRKAYQIMSVAYNSKNLSVPTGILTDILLYKTEEDLIGDCEHYGILVKDNLIYFSKTSFNSAPVISPRHESFVEEKLSLYTLPDLILV